MQAQASRQKSTSQKNTRARVHPQNIRLPLPRPSRTATKSTRGHHAILSLEARSRSSCRTIKRSDRHWQHASTEAGDVEKPMTHKLNRLAPVRCNVLSVPSNLMHQSTSALSATMNSESKPRRLATQSQPATCRILTHYTSTSDTHCCLCGRSRDTPARSIRETLRHPNRSPDRL